MKPTSFFKAGLFLLAAHSSVYAQNSVDPLSLQVSNLLEQTTKQGLIRSRYAGAEARLAAAIQAGQSDVAQKQMSELITKIAADLVTGQVKAQDLNYRTIVTVKKLQKDQIDSVTSYINNSMTAAELVDSLKPKNSHYKKLVEALQRYQNEEATGIKAAPQTLSTIKSGVKDTASILYARYRLNLLGYTNDISNESLDEELKNAIVSFQKNQGLTADGILGSGSWKILSQDLAGQISQLKISIDRTRWLPNDMGTNHVFVNLAQQKLKLYINSELSMEFKTVNGRLDRPTPILFDTLSHLILNPTWTVPQNILLADKKPMFMANPQKVLDLHMKVIDDITGKEVDPFSVDWSLLDENHIPYTLVQQPGKHNALGFIKFPLTNPYAIYLHDTDSRNLFAGQDRLKSSGCVRLEKPFEFAEKVLASTEWTADRLRDASENLSPEAETSTRIKLARSMPVYLFYLTASVNEDGQIILVNDSYDLDMQTYKLLKK